MVVARYHNDYASARRAFRQMAGAGGFDTEALDVDAPGPEGEECTIDVAVKGRGIPRRAVVVSSGTHGVEGYFGSAVQLELLYGLLNTWEPKDGQAVVLVHAVNPWGMAHKRRVNEDGVDLNRNFRKEGDAFAGCPEGYHRLDRLLNPPTPPGGFDPFLLDAGVQLARFGLGALKEAVASGQYEYPHGLFYGGSGPTTSQRLLRRALTERLEHAERVVHVDLHTGSGKWGTYVNAVDMPMDAERVTRLRRELGDTVEGFDPKGVLYTIHGALGPWLQSILPGVVYDCMLTEFGTYAPLKVISAMRFENRVVRFAADDPKLRAQAAARMLETFCPADPAWRERCLAAARRVVEQAMAANLA